MIRVVGVAEDGSTSFDAPLDHGGELPVLASHHGFRIVRPLQAHQADGELLIMVQVVPLGDDVVPAARTVARDPGLDRAGDVPPVVRQRLAAYAVVESSLGLLATQFSDRTAVRGRWGLPGGGLDEAEEPQAAVLREVHEETAQRVALDELVRVQTSHWVGRSPRGVVEDFHAVRLVYRARCADPTTPKVLDVGGTTAAARWVPLTSWRSLRWTTGWWEILTDLYG